MTEENTGTPGNEKQKEILKEFNLKKLPIVKEEKIKYTESIETIMSNGLKRWIKIKVSGKGLGIEEAATDAKTKFDKALNVVLSNPSPTPSITDYNTGESIEEKQIRALKSSVDHEDARINGFITDINACTQIDIKNQFGVQVGLLSFEHLTRNSKIKEAYENKLKELS